MADRRRSETVDVIRGWLFEAAPDNHAEPVSDSAVAGRAVDVIALLPAHDHSFIDRDGKFFDILACGVFAGVKRGVFVESAARDCAFERLPFTASVRKEIAGTLRPILRLILHVE